jgi:hypothetical protein
MKKHLNVYLQNIYRFKQGINIKNSEKYVYISFVTNIVM